MDKIKALFEQVGLSPELTTKLCAVLERHKTMLREQSDAEVKRRVEQAKQVCLDETEAHKRELSRRLQVFLETKSAVVTAAITKQSAIRESRATEQLRKVTALLGGVDLNGASEGRSQAAESQLRKQLVALKEERDMAVRTANRQTAIADRVIRRNRALEMQGPQPQPRAPLTEATTQPRRQPGRIDGSRTTQRPTTTRTVTEDRQRRPRQDADPEIQRIADQID